MKSSAIGRRYATALIELADEQKQTARVEKDLEAFASTWGGSKELRDAFENPKVSQEARKKILAALLDRLGAAPLLASTLQLLSDRRRMRHVPELAEAFQRMAEERTGKIRAEVTSAAPLPDAYFAQLQKALEQATGKDVVLVKQQDPSLIAGVVTRVGDTVFDGSVKTRLEELKEKLLAV